MHEPYDWDEYAATFFPKAAELANTASKAEEKGEIEKAAEYYLCKTETIERENPELANYP